MRIGSVDVYKFLFSWVICLYHFYNAVYPNPYFPMGEIVVELFVLISGVFLYMGWDRKKARQAAEGGRLSPYDYLKRRFLRFLPATTLGFALAAGVRAWLFAQEGGAFHLRQLLTWMSDDIWEILLVEMNGMNGNETLLNVPVWTVSAMLIAEFVVFALLVNFEKRFTTLICPLVLLIGYGYWRHIPDADHDIWVGFTTFGVLRVFMLVCLAWYCWKLIQRLRKIRFTKTGSVVLGVVELLLYGGALALLMHFNTRSFRWMVTLMFVLAVTISASGASFTHRLMPAGKVTRWLGELSMGVYLTHYPIMRIYKQLWPEAKEMFYHKFSFLAVVLVTSVLFCLAVRLVEKGASRIAALWRRVAVASAETGIGT